MAGLAFSGNGLSLGAVATASFPRGQVSLADYAPTDGTSNATSGLNAAMAAVVALGGGEVIVPENSFSIDPVTIPPYVRIRGAVRGPFAYGVAPTTTPRWPTFLARSTGAPLMTTGYGCAIEDVGFFYPTQILPTSPTPTAFPETIYIPNSSAGDVTIRGCTFINSYDCINCNSGRVRILHNNFGGYHTNLNFDACEDFLIVEGNLFQPFYDIYTGFTFPQLVDTWVKSNRSNIICRRVDVISASDNSMFYGFVALQFLDTQLGVTPTNGSGKFVNTDADTFTYGAIVKSANNGGGGYRLVNFDVGPTDIGVSALSIQTGGPYPPQIAWDGGSTRGSWTTGTNGIDTGVAGTGLPRLENIRGYNPRGLISGIAFPLTTVNWTNTTGLRVRAFIKLNGATVTAFGLNATPTGITTECSLIFEPGDTFTPVFTGGPPTWTLFGV